MPCTYTGSLAGNQILGLRETVGRQKEELDKLTRYLCGTFSYLSSLTDLDVDDVIAEVEDTAEGIEPLELMYWWEDHKKEDEEYATYLKLKEKFDGGNR